jgi:hypothetical protein
MMPLRMPLTSMLASIGSRARAAPPLKVSEKLIFIVQNDEDFVIVSR